MEGVLHLNPRGRSWSSQKPRRLADARCFPPLPSAAPEAAGRPPAHGGHDPRRGREDRRHGRHAGPGEDSDPAPESGGAVERPAGQGQRQVSPLGPSGGRSIPGSLLIHSVIFNPKEKATRPAAESRWFHMCLSVKTMSSVAAVLSCFPSASSNKSLITSGPGGQ